MFTWNIDMRYLIVICGNAAIFLMRVYVFLYRLIDLYVSIRLFTGEISLVLNLMGIVFN